MRTRVGLGFESVCNPTVTPLNYSRNFLSVCACDGMNFDASQLFILCEFEEVYNYKCIKGILNYIHAKFHEIWMIIVTCRKLQSWRFETGILENLGIMTFYHL